MSREGMLFGDGEPIYVSETETRQGMVATIYLNETVATATTIINPLSGLFIGGATMSAISVLII